MLAELCEGINRIGVVANDGLKAVRDGLTELQQGNLTRQMPENLKGVFHDIAIAMNATTGTLSQTMQTISETSLTLDIV